MNAMPDRPGGSGYERDDRSRAVPRRDGGSMDDIELVATPLGPFPGSAAGRLNWIERRRDKAVEEILRNRRGDYTVPTWVLATLLAAIVLGWIALIIVS